VGKDTPRRVVSLAEARPTPKQPDPLPAAGAGSEMRGHTLEILRMNDSMRAGMAEALRLTRSGQLLEATAAIQRTLWGQLTPTQTATAPARSLAETVNGPRGVTPAELFPTATPPQRRVGSTHPATGVPPLLPTVAESAPASRYPGTGRIASLLNSPAGPSQEAPVLISPPQGSEPASSTGALTGRTTQFPAMPLPALGGRSRRGLSFPPEPVPHHLPSGGQFIQGVYTGVAGTLTYRLFLPSGYEGESLPLVVMLHGCTQTVDEFAAGTRMNILAEQERFLVVYPAQATAANPSRCWHWFRAADQHRDRGEPALIAGITHQVVGAYAVDPRQVYVAGLSAGGAMAVVMGMNYPDLYAAIGVHSGLAYGVAHDLPSALAAMRHGCASAAPQDSRLPAVESSTPIVPTLVFHGNRDATVHPRNGDQILADWAWRYAGGGPDTLAGAKLHVTVSRGQVPAGRAYTRSRYHDASGRVVLERWRVYEAGHGWSGGSPQGTFTDPQGPDASQAMIRFFYQQRQREPEPPSTAEPIV